MLGKLLKRVGLFVVFGESHLAVLSLTDGISRSLCSKLPFLGLFPSKTVNFYPVTRVHGLIGRW
jgi:hypothetical protein